MDRDAVLEKVAVFITRSERDLLLLRHPYAGVQIPAGTVEPMEQPVDAAKREAWEETGLEALSVPEFLGVSVEDLPGDQGVLIAKAQLYARPDETSFNWAYLPRAARVELLRGEAEYAQVRFREWDQEPERSYISMEITGWVPSSALAKVEKRSFFHMESVGETLDQWDIRTDNHVYHLFWAPLDALPHIISPQDAWLSYLFRKHRNSK